MSSAAHGAALLRISLGVITLAHGLLKVFVFGFDGTVGFFGSIGYPALFAYLVIIGEVFGGLALITGVLSRLAAVLLLPQMIGVVLFHLPNGWIFTAPKGGYEYPLFWTLLLLASALIGPGSFALGRRILPGKLADL